MCEKPHICMILDNLEIVDWFFWLILLTSLCTGPIKSAGEMFFDQCLAFHITESMDEVK